MCKAQYEKIMKYEKNNLTWDYTVEHDTNGNYYFSLKTDIFKEMLTQAAFKKVYRQFHYFSVKLSYNEIQVFPDRQFISNHVLGLEHFHYSASTKLGIT